MWVISEKINFEIDPEGENSIGDSLDGGGHDLFQGKIVNTLLLAQ